VVQVEAVEREMPRHLAGGKSAAARWLKGE